MNIDDKIIKLLNQYDHDSNMFTVDLVSQIKQSILKAIMEKLNILMDDERIKQLEYNFELYSRGWDKRHCPMCGASPSKQKKMILSVIKEVLGK